MFPEPQKVLKIFIDPEGRAPFQEWYDEISNTTFKQRIDARLNRLRLGNFGDCKSVGDGVRELRIHAGPAFRVYFGHHDSQIVVLLLGGDKHGQKKDIKKAKSYWKTYQKKTFSKFY